MKWSLARGYRKQAERTVELELLGSATILFVSTHRRFVSSFGWTMERQKFFNNLTTNDVISRSNSKGNGITGLFFFVWRGKTNAKKRQMLYLLFARFNVKSVRWISQMCSPFNKHSDNLFVYEFDRFVHGCSKSRFYWHNRIVYF